MKTKPAKEEQRPFVTDIQELRRRAREHMEMGAVTSGYSADRETGAEELLTALRTLRLVIWRKSYDSRRAKTQ